LKNEWNIHHPVKILHVDDDVIQLQLVSEFFKLFEPTFETTTVTTPSEALELLKKEFFDCIILDYNMPEIDGIEFARNIRINFRTPIILYTGQGSEEVAERAFEVGIDDYLRKEIDPSHYHVLIKRIKNVVEKNHTEELYYNVVEDARDSLCILLDGKIILHNQSMNNLLNLDMEISLLEKNIEDFIIKDDKIRFQEWIQPDEEEKLNESNFEIFTFIKKNGKKIEVEISKSKISWHGRKAKILFLRDITIRKKIEAERQLSNERFKTLVELAPDGILSLNPFGYATFVNNAFLKLTGFSKEEIIGKHLTSIGTIRKKDLLKHIRTFTSILQGRVPEPIEFHYVNKDGTPRLGEAHISLIEVSGKKEMLLIARDITSRKRKEKEYRNLFDLAPDGIIELDLDGNLLSVNQAILKLTGYKKRDLEDKYFFEIKIFKDHSETEAKKLFSSLIKNKKLKPFEFRMLRKDQSFLWVEAHPSKIIINDEILGLQIIIRDISERKTKEKASAEHAEQLERLVEERTNEILKNERMVAAGQIASMIGHDIRNPLQTIKNSVYLIKKGNQPIDKLLTVIEDSINLSIKLLEEFRDQTKSEPVKFKKVNIVEIIEKALIKVQIRNNIIIKRNISKDIPLLEIDGFKFRRVIDNLIKNSIEAMPSGGELQIDAFVVEETLEVRISDTGHGIPEQVMKKLFKPFQTTKESGMGLGLLFCKNSIEEFGGTINVFSKENKGTTFTIKIPLRLPQNINIEDSPKLINLKDQNRAARTA
jgi:PAS domain S-box-containing protein